jgi:Protein of unknown function (DUF2785)
MENITERASDKQFLQAIVDNNNHIPDDIDYFLFLKALLQNFASTDPQLRDNLTYSVLAHAIIDQDSQQKLTPSQVEDLLLTCIDEEHLFYHIGEAGTDTVFMRSFSLLIIAAVLFADAKTLRLSEQVTRQAQTALLHYAKEEKDWRGYIKGKGWAHAAAHLSDALDECAQNRYMVTPDREAVMRTIRDIARLPEPLCSEEDDRLAFAAYRVIANQLVEEAFLAEWIESFFVQREQDIIANEQNLVSWVRASNAENVLRSLYFRLLWSNKAAHLLEPISNVLRRLDSIPAEWLQGEQ